MTVHLIIGEDYGDIVYWKKNLPPKKFGYYVCRILRAEMNGGKASIPVPSEKMISNATIDVKFEVNEKDLIKYIKSFPKRRRSEMMKEILRKHIAQAYKDSGIKAPRRVVIKAVIRDLTNVKSLLEQFEESVKDMQNRESLVLERYKAGLDHLIGFYKDRDEGLPLK